MMERMRKRGRSGRGEEAKPVIGITMGDPAGVGPELCLRALRSHRVLSHCVPVVFGDAAVLRRVSRACRWPFRVPGLPLKKFEQMPITSVPTVIQCGMLDADAVRPGIVQKACGQAAGAYIEAAVRAAQAGRIAAIATAPIHKDALHRAGIPYPGHTELLAALTGTKRYCMLMASDEITVSLVTCHVGLDRVKSLLSRKRVLDVILLTAEAMQRLGRCRPNITVCALNPHAGEHSLFGSEEADVIVPAIAAARSRGLSIRGPLPPDTAFLPKLRRATDAYVAMYHDQGLIPFKMLAFDKGVNITLGLPIVRTSVDHGTAFDIAWQGKASAESLIQSVLWAVRLAGEKG